MTMKPTYKRTEVLEWKKTQNYKEDVAHTRAGVNIFNNII